MKHTPDQKLSILLAGLNERYKSIHEIRARLQTICFWLLGILVAIAGWLLQSQVVLDYEQKFLYSAITVTMFVYLRFFYFRDIERGFNTQCIVASKIEKALHLYEKNYFSSEQIYPEVWKLAGSKDKKGNFFAYNYGLIVAGIVFLLVIIWWVDLIQILFTL